MNKREFIGRVVLCAIALAAGTALAEMKDAPSLGVPRRVLELPPGSGSSRNSEGDFAVLKDDRFLVAYCAENNLKCLRMVVIPKVPHAADETVCVGASASAGGDGSAARPFASLAGALARVRQSGRGVRPVTLRFKAGNYFLPDGLTLGADDSHLRFVGEKGVVMTGGRGCRVERTEIVHCVFGGVRISAGDRPALTRADHVVADCEIHDFSRTCRTYKPAVSVGGCGISVRGCKIHDAGGGRRRTLQVRDAGLRLRVLRGDGARPLVSRQQVIPFLMPFYLFGLSKMMQLFYNSHCETMQLT